MDAIIEAVARSSWAQFCGVMAALLGLIGAWLVARAATTEGPPTSIREGLRRWRRFFREQESLKDKRIRNAVAVGVVTAMWVLAAAILAFFGV